MRVLSTDLSSHIGERVTLAGWLHAKRELGAVSFVLVRDRAGLAQAVANHTQWIAQVEAIGVTLVFAILGTTIIAFIVKAMVGLRVDEEVETIGLDLSEHGEEAYHGA